MSVECETSIQQILGIREGFGRFQHQVIRNACHARAAGRKWSAQSVARSGISRPTRFVAITLRHLSIITRPAVPSTTSTNTALWRPHSLAGTTPSRRSPRLWGRDADVTCSDGAYILYATRSHITWDPNTLAGTADHTYLIPACGHPAGYAYTDQIQIKQSS